MKQKLFLYFLFLTITAFKCYSQKGGQEIPGDSTKLFGIVLNKTEFSNRMAILMRDTTLEGNRFDYQWHKGTDTSRNISSQNCQLPAFLIDSTLATYCDSLLLFDSENKNIVLTSSPKKNQSKLVRKFIRLYIGYIDDVGNKNVVVQFTSSSDFKEYNLFYKKELFLVVPRKELHFAVINIGH